MVIYMIYCYGLQNCDVSVVIFKNIEKIQLAARKFPVLKQSRKYLPTQQTNIQSTIQGTERRASIRTGKIPKEGIPGSFMKGTQGVCKKILD